MAIQIHQCNNCNKQQKCSVDPFNGVITCNSCRNLIGQDAQEGPIAKHNDFLLENHLFSAYQVDDPLLDPPKNSAKEPQVNPIEEELPEPEPRDENEDEDEVYLSTVDESEEYTPWLSESTKVKLLYTVTIIVCIAAISIFGYELNRRLKKSSQPKDATPAEITQFSKPAEVNNKPKNHSLQQTIQKPSANEILQILYQQQKEAIANIYPATVVVIKHAHRRDLTKIGTGFIYDRMGRVITNYHVISGPSSQITITFHNERLVKCEIEAVDEVSDLAVLQILNFHQYRKEVTIAKWGDSDKISLGDSVFLVGHPGNLKYTVAKGSIAHQNRYLNVSFPLENSPNMGYFTNWIQLDASLNKGYSGGPLVDMEGDVIGINTRKGEEIQGVGFSIPGNYARQIIKDLIRYNKVPRSAMGIIWHPHWTPPNIITGGAKILAVLPRSPAEDAGLRDNDIVTQIGNTEVNARIFSDIPKLRITESRQAIGMSVKLKIVRDGEHLTKSIVPIPRHSFFNNLTYFQNLGFWGAPLTPALREYLKTNVKRGIWICRINPNSFLQRGGAFADEIIMGINTPFRNDQEFFHFYHKLPKRQRIKILLQNGQQIRSINVLISR